ncbi:MAG: hypothetical protein AB7I27_05800 [Bacteriovoracaceae bacterium]
MKGLSSFERMVLESIGTKKQSYGEIQYQTGLHENVCFNVIQALIIRGLLKSEEGYYRINETISPLMMDEINGLEAKQGEALEAIETILEQSDERVFRFQKIALDSRDEKIFLAMLSNLESFLLDAHKKSQSTIPLKERKIIFWGVGEVQKMTTQMIRG